MKEILIDCVDDGINGYMRTFVDGEIIQADDPYNFFDMLLTALGFNAVYNNIEEEV
jgi:hypothetical protein